MKKNVFQILLLFFLTWQTERSTVTCDLLREQLWWFGHVFLIHTNCTQISVWTSWPVLVVDYPELFQNWTTNLVQPDNWKNQSRRGKIFRQKTHFITHPWLNINGTKQNKQAVALSWIWYNYAWFWLVYVHWMVMSPVTCGSADEGSSKLCLMVGSRAALSAGIKWWHCA